MALPIPAYVDVPESSRVRRFAAAARRGSLNITRDPLALVGAIILLAAIVGAVAAPLLARYDPNYIDVIHRFQGPTAAHWLGTDELGRDLFSRILYGGRVSLSLSFVSISFAAAIGMLLGGIAGIFGGWLDIVIMRVADIVLSFPAVLFAIVLIAFLGVSLTNVVIAIAVAYTPSFIRIAYSSTLVASGHGYVDAARSLGVGEFRILRRHVFPNILPVFLVQFTLSLAGAILVESSLSYLGLGVQPPQPSWGAMIADGQLYFSQSPYPTLFPGLTIMLVVLGFNFLGDGLAESLDPRLRMRTG